MYLAFLKRFLRWKQRRPLHRDCLFLTTLDVDAAKCVTFTWLRLTAKKQGLAAQEQGLATQTASSPPPTTPYVTVRQILLPFELGRSVESYRARDSTRYAFPPGLQLMDHGAIEYSVGDISPACSPYIVWSEEDTREREQQHTLWGGPRTPLYFAPLGRRDA